MRIRDYLRRIVDEDRERANTGPLPFFVGRTVRGAAALALLMLMQDAFNLFPWEFSPVRRLVFAVSLGAALALQLLWLSRWRLPEQTARG